MNSDRDILSQTEENLTCDKTSQFESVITKYLQEITDHSFEIMNLKKKIQEELYIYMHEGECRKTEFLRRE